MLEYASAGIIITDAQGRIQIVNAKVEELFGYRREELIGMSWSHWEFGAGFGVYDLSRGEWNEELLNALIPQEQ